MSNDIVRPQSLFQEKYLKSNAKILVVGGAAGCLPADTEYLSRDGWKRIDEYDGGDVAQVILDENDRTNVIVDFIKPKEYVKLPCDGWFSIKSGDFEMVGSAEHTAVYWTSKEKYKTIDFESIASKQSFNGRIKSTFSHVTSSGIGLTEDELRLQVMVNANGVTNESCTYLKLNKEHHRSRYEQFKYRSVGVHTDNNYIVNPKLVQKHYAGIFWDANNKDLEIIYDELSNWFRGDYKSRHKVDADFVQYVYASQGYTSEIIKCKNVYVVKKYKKSYHTLSSKKKTSVLYEHVNGGTKYCFETDTGYFLVRQNGNIFVTGNSSKSYVGLMRHLRWVHDANYRGFCIRKNSTAIMKAGGLYEQAYRLYSKVFPKQVERKLKDQKLVFPSGASISFSHYENDSAADLYQGLELSSVFYDEGTHAEEHHIWWLFSRLRSEADMGDAEPCMWISCNPDPDSFLFEWVKWWLYPEGHESYGLPNPERNGKTRWLLRQGDDLIWGDTREELFEIYKKPELTDDHEDQIRPISFQVLLGNIDDNPSLKKSNPNYKASLEALPEVERRRLLLGDWTARAVGSTYFQRSWCPEAQEEPPKSEIVKTVRAYDFAGTLKSAVNNSPDYTACAKISKLKNGDYFVHEVIRTRILSGDWEKFILQNAAADGYDTEIIIPLDPGASAKLATSLLTRAISERGYRVRTMRASGSKLDRFRPFSSLSMNGHVTFLSNCGIDLANEIYNNNNFIYKELEAFNGKPRRGESGHDDQADCISDAIAVLASRVNIPNMSKALSSTNLKNHNPLTS